MAADFAEQKVRCAECRKTSTIRAPQTHPDDVAVVKWECPCGAVHALSEHPELDDIRSGRAAERAVLVRQVLDGSTPEARAIAKAVRAADKSAGAQERSQRG
jgi:hypothetical protein